MKFNILSKVGMLGGFLLFLATETRYFVLNPDMDKALFFGIVALLVIFISFMWSLLIDTRRILDQVEIYLSDLNSEENE